MAERATQSKERSKEDESGKFWAGVQMFNQRPRLAPAVSPFMFSCTSHELQCWAMTAEHYNGDCRHYGGEGGR
jgi:hypothetical protein